MYKETQFGVTIPRARSSSLDANSILSEFESKSIFSRKLFTKTTCNWQFGAANTF